MNKTVLIGLDGATFSILDPLMAEGHMPFLKNFLKGFPGQFIVDPQSLDSSGLGFHGHRPQSRQSRGL